MKRGQYGLGLMKGVRLVNDRYSRRTVPCPCSSPGATATQSAESALNIISWVGSSHHFSSVTFHLVGKICILPS